MRNIKFRVFLENQDGTYTAYHSDPLFPHIFWQHVNNGIFDKDVQCYTGLKDKNGIEIFEGDIVLYKNRYNPYDKTESTGKIIFQDGSFVIVDDELKGFYYLGLFEVEIIGNIYQNPKILNKGE